MTEPTRVLCTFRGCLVVMEVTENLSGGRCPDCGSATLSEHDGWMECDGECGFAIGVSDWDRITAYEVSDGTKSNE